MYIRLCAEYHDYSWFTAVIILGFQSQNTGFPKSEYWVSKVRICRRFPKCFNYLQ